MWDLRLASALGAPEVLAILTRREPTAAWPAVDVVICDARGCGQPRAAARMREPRGPPRWRLGQGHGVDDDSKEI